MNYQTIHLIYNPRLYFRDGTSHSKISKFSNWMYFCNHTSKAKNVCHSTMQKIARSLSTNNVFLQKEKKNVTETECVFAKSLAFLSYFILKMWYLKLRCITFKVCILKLGCTLACFWFVARNLVWRKIHFFQCILTFSFSLEFCTFTIVLKFWDIYHNRV